ncbi:hypothetical protein M514_04672 [Trichuris suis]|uniref:Uncharacterized protein n=1 Tax=Trichuris suis TaxID=68888 RepID=A0A085N3T5_9BILA|nr:hypothetical protein M513_04672 [Trichuris suis]KFD64131.1 hypothetical protein M514_04672 [Trichuris suis]
MAPTAVTKLNVGMELHPFPVFLHYSTPSELNQPLRSKGFTFPDVIHASYIFFVPVKSCLILLLLVSNSLQGPVLRNMTQFSVAVDHLTLANASARRNAPRHCGCRSLSNGHKLPSLLAPMSPTGFFGGVE